MRSSESYLHPGRRAKAVANGETVAVFGEIHPDTAAKYGIDRKIYTAEIALSSLYASHKAQPIYKPLPKFPAVTRDLSLVCDRSVPVAELDKAIRSVKSRIIEDVKLFDVLRRRPHCENKKSVAIPSCSVPRIAHLPTMSAAMWSERSLRRFRKSAPSFAHN